MGQPNAAEVGQAAASRIIINAHRINGARCPISTRRAATAPSTLCLPGVARELRDRVGLSEALIRISIGIENVEDLISSLAQGLNMGDSGRELSVQTMDQGRLRSYRAATLETNATLFRVVLPWRRLGD